MIDTAKSYIQELPNMVISGWVAPNDARRSEHFGVVMLASFLEMLSMIPGYRTEYGKYDIFGSTPTITALVVHMIAAVRAR